MLTEKYKYFYKQNYTFNLRLSTGSSSSGSSIFCPDALTLSSAPQERPLLPPKNPFVDSVKIKLRLKRVWANCKLLLLSCCYALLSHLASHWPSLQSVICSVSHPEVGGPGVRGQGRCLEALIASSTHTQNTHKMPIKLITIRLTGETKNFEWENFRPELPRISLSHSEQFLVCVVDESIKISNIYSQSRIFPFCVMNALGVE